MFCFDFLYVSMKQYGIGGILKLGLKYENLKLSTNIEIEKIFHDEVWALYDIIN